MEDTAWFSLLIEGSRRQVGANLNLERVEALSKISGYETIEYVLKTLDFLTEKAGSCRFNSYVRTALQWSEVAKCGSEERRKRWKEMGINLAIHNEGSAEIYNLYNLNPENDRTEQENRFEREVVSQLIRVHGTIGQYLRGEISEYSFQPVYELYDNMTEGKYGEVCSKEAVLCMLRNLTGAVVYGVSDSLWEAIRPEVELVISRIPDHSLEFSLKERFVRIKPDFCKEVPDGAKKYSFWFPHVALNTFSDDVFLEIFRLAIEEADRYENVRDINFKPISTFLYYDYKGKKHINIYKKRIVESFIKTGSNKHVNIHFYVEDDVLFADFILSKTCEKLVEFCDEAELSGDISYEKAIVMLFDFFDFRHDTFDRLNNEDSYLSTMNDISSSRKGELINFVIGDKIVDVGSGSGILLDILEERYPTKKILGTDISSAVIETLKKKKSSEGHNWEVRVHNFVDSELEECSTIIFSSILHEIYSYTEGETGRFDRKSVENALKNAYESLSKGGRILIRDGVKTPSEDDVLLLIKTKEAFEFFENYRRDFQGLTEYSREKIEVTEVEGGHLVKASINFIREFMYTLTWGPGSYFNEVKEQFGYFTISDFIDFFEKLGARILIAESYFETDYQIHLSPMVSIMDLAGQEIPYPDSNCFVIVEKI